jgi:Toastrack DUF4097
MSTSISPMAILTASLALAAGAAHADNFQRQVAADPHGEVDISNVAGEISITGWDKAEVSVGADLPSDTRRIRITSAAGHTRVCVTYGSGCDSSGWFDHKGPVRLDLHVPQGSRIDASGVSAGITSHGILGVQHLNTVSGEIRGDLGAGDDGAKSVSGTIVLHGSGQDGTLNVATVSGDLHVTNVAGELEARTVNGTLDAQMSRARIARLTTTSGSIDLSARLARGGTIETETVSGDQKVDVTGSAGYSYEAKTFSGAITNCFGQQPQHNEYGPGNRLEGERGAGDGHLRIRSLSGDVSLCDR